jgi:hypothetical protein
MTTLTVNDLATGAWSTAVGTKLELVAAGANPRHVLVKVPGQRHVFGFPVKWLSGMPGNAPTEPETCPCCGREL